MNYFNGLDYTIIVVYFGILIALGFYLKRMASASLEDYFLGGKSLPWWALGISGMASSLDVTGTMVIVSFLYLLGPRGLYIAFRGGACLVLVFFLIWLGKWHRRSNCMTGAEWMIYRFGGGLGGQFARITSVIAIFLFTVGMLAYMAKGVGLFLSMFLPLSPLACTTILFVVATTYTMVSGFYGVVFTDIFQVGIVLLAVITVSIMAMLHSGSLQQLSQVAEQVTGSTNWATAFPQSYTQMPKGYEVYQCLRMFAMFYLFKTILQGLGMGCDPKYFGARNERECGTLSFLWGWMLMFRWPLMISMAVLGLYIVKELIPDQTVLFQASELIKQQSSQISPALWQSKLAEIINNPGSFSPQFIDSLKNLLGADNWHIKLNLLSFNGTVNPERIIPAVLLYKIPFGLRGLILVALIAASMSTFDSSVNAATGFFTRDIYQGYIRPKASTRELIFASYVFVFVLVATGYALGYTAKSINHIWGWIMMGLSAGMLIPYILRLYWWRFNGIGFAVGLVAGLISAVAQRIVYPDMVEWKQFVVISLIGLVSSIVGTYLGKTTEKDVLENFYRTTRPFGLWGPLKSILSQNVRVAMEREHFYDIISLPFALGWQITLFLLPMLFIIRNFKAFWITFVIFAVCLIGMYFFWYRNLPIAEEK